MQNKRKFDALVDSDRNAETSDVETELDLVDSESKLEKYDVEPKQYLGRIYEIRSDKTPLFYVGSTILSLQKRFNGHTHDSKHGQSPWNKAFKQFEDSWKINQVGETLIFAGISKQEMKKQLLEKEYEHMGKFPRDLLLNDFFGSSPSIAAESKREQTIKDYSVDEAMKVKQRKIEAGKKKSRGSVSLTSDKKRWRFRWVDDKNQHFKSFPTQETALAFQQTIFPNVVFPNVALPPDPSYVYLIFHPDQTKVYIGQTSLRLTDRMSQHRKQARKGDNEFYLLMNRTGPLIWEIKAIHTLYESSNEEIRAVELFCLRQYQPTELFNRNLNTGGMTLVRYWFFSYYVGGKKHSKAFYETKKRSLQEAEKDAKEFQRKHIEAGRGGNGSLIFQKAFRAYGPFGGNTKNMTKQFTITQSVSEEQAKAAAEEWLAEIRSIEDIRNERIAKAAIEKSATFVREFQVKCDK